MKSNSKHVQVRPLSNNCKMICLISPIGASELCPVEYMFSIIAGKVAGMQVIRSKRTLVTATVNALMEITP